MRPFFREEKLMYTLEECERIWDEAGQHGAPEERIARAGAWLPYYAYLAEPMKQMPVHQGEDANSFPAYLLREGLVRGSDTVLDIGAGMGGDTVAFAAHCQKVTALELSGDCLEVLQHRAEGLGLKNIETVQLPWEDYRPTERFDVCYSSMCPAICNTEELRRMESLSKRLCCLVTVMRGSYDRHRKAMMADLGIQPKGGMVTELIHYFNALYLMGRQPNVVCRTLHREYDVPVEKLLEQYPIYFRIFGVEEARSRAFLEDYLSRNAENGLLHEESHINFALISWKPGEA